MFRGMSIGSLLLIFAIIALMFGTKRLRTMGEDLGSALRGFRKGLSEETTTSTPTQAKSSEADV